MAYSNILPAPGTLLNRAGVLDPLGLPAPGFSGLNITSNYSTNVNRSRSNRGLVIDDQKHYWSFTINYHPMQKDEFDAIEAFILGHNTRKIPFYVSLPNYSGPSNVALRNYLLTNNVKSKFYYYAGESEVIINMTGAPNMELEPGMFINFNDPNDALHKATYKVGRVETPTVHAGVSPGASAVRLTLFPPLQRDLPVNVPVTIINPLFRVIQRNELSPSFDENNVVSFNLQVEEILP